MDNRRAFNSCYQGNFVGQISWESRHTMNIRKIEVVLSVINTDTLGAEHKLFQQGKKLDMQKVSNNIEYINEVQY